METTRLRRTEALIRGARDNPLLHRSWLPAEPERVLLVVHGLAEHSGRYDHFGAWFAARNAAVHAYDQRGHGRSAGVRGYVRRFSEFLDDLDAVLRYVRGLHPGLPVCLVGHSMGGLVVSAFTRERQPDVAAVVTSGAALKLRPDVSTGSVRMARLLSRVLPRLRFEVAFDPADLAGDPEVGRKYLDDPLVFRKITVSLAREIFGAIERTGGGGADVRLPMLMLHGEADPICPVEGSCAFFEDLPHAGKRLHTYPGLLHEIFNEPSHEKVFEDLQRWLDERMG
ncbi:MAG: alpha/beta hydrolase [Myxococcota bacterium]